MLHNIYLVCKYSQHFSILPKTLCRYYFLFENCLNNVASCRLIDAGKAKQICCFKSRFSQKRKLMLSSRGLSTSVHAHKNVLQELKFSTVKTKIYSKRFVIHDLFLLYMYRYLQFYIRQPYGLVLSNPSVERTYQPSVNSINDSISIDTQKI